MDKAYIGLIGVALGAGVGLIGTYLNILNSKNQRLREKKEDTYFKAINVITRHASEIASYKPPEEQVFRTNDLLLEYNSMKAYMTIYGTTEIYKCFKDIVKEIIESKSILYENGNKVNVMFEEFEEMIRENLK